MPDKTKLIVIAGPTATGKTDLAAYIASDMNGEIISADSMQIYKYLNIGTAKPRDGEYPGVTFHLTDIIDPDRDFTVADFCAAAHGCIESVAKRRKIPILAGGTGFYIKACLYDAQFTQAPPNSDYRRFLYSLARINGNDFLHALLAANDPAAAERIHKNNVIRIIRALEYYNQTGLPISAHNFETARNENFYDFLFIETGGQRNQIYENVNKRVDLMLAMGLKDETESVLRMGYEKNLKPLRAIGYKEMVGHIEGKATLSETAEAIKRNTRHFVKRQLTWLANKFSVEKLYAASFCKEEILKKCLMFMDKK